MEQRGALVGRAEVRAVRWQPGGWLSGCSLGRRHGRERCCCARPGACPGPGSLRGPRGPDRPAPAASSACKEAQHRHELVTRVGEQRDDRGAFSPHLPQAGEAQPPGGPECCPGEAWGRGPAQGHSGELLNTQSLRFSVCKTETITSTSSGLLAKSIRGPDVMCPCSHGQ